MVKLTRFAKLIPFNPSNPLTLAESIKSEKSLRDIIDTDETLSNVVDISLKLRRCASTCFYTCSWCSYR